MPNTKVLEICNKCIIPNGFNGNALNTEGTCKYCETNDYTGKKRNISQSDKQKYTRQLDSYLHSLKGSGRFYDIAIGYSGGKDSTYLAMVLKEKYGLKVLGIVIDHSFFPKKVEENIKNVSQKLSLDIFTYSVDKKFMEKFFKRKMDTYHKHSKAVFDVICGDCSNIIEGTVMKIAAQMGIECVLIGLSPEQTNRYFFEMPKDHLENNWVNDFWADNYFNDSDRKQLWNSETLNEKQLRVYFPFHVWDYDVNEISTKLEAEGVLDKCDSDPLSTECKVLQTIRHIDKKNLGYDPRIGPFSDLVRIGSANRAELINKFYFEKLDSEAIKEVERRLNISHLV